MNQYEIEIEETYTGLYEWKLYRITVYDGYYTLKVLTNSGCERSLEEANETAKLCIPKDARIPKYQHSHITHRGLS